MSYLPEPDRLCPECGTLDELTITATDTELQATCIACGWTASQPLEDSTPAPAKEPDPMTWQPQTARRPAPAPTPTRPPYNPKRTPILHRRSPSAANKNLPLEPNFPLCGPTTAYRLLRQNGPPQRPWPKWCETLAPILFTACMLAWVWAAIAGVPLPGPTGHHAQVTTSWVDDGTRDVCGFNERSVWSCVTGAQQVGETWCGVNELREASCVVPKED